MDENWLRPSPKAVKPVVGREFNQLRQAAACVETEELISDIQLRVSAQATDTFQFSDVAVAEVKATPDLTLPGNRRPLGSIHPVTRVQREIEDIFLDLGFWIETGPEIESVYYNFDALNIPETHPSRDDWDTLYIDAKTVLRTHTSPVQIRAMEKHGAPLYIITPGKCYRHDNPDATHSPMFHQIEGLAIDTDITFADLKGTLDFFAKKFFRRKGPHPIPPELLSFHGAERRSRRQLLRLRRERLPKVQGEWMDRANGLRHGSPASAAIGGIDPDRYSGWAFGLGIDRFAMVKYDINDIQLFFQGDVRFLEQF